MAELPSIRNAVQRTENVCKNSFLNYESPALAVGAKGGLSIAHFVDGCRIGSVFRIIVR